MKNMGTTQWLHDPKTSATTTYNQEWCVWDVLPPTETEQQKNNYITKISKIDGRHTTNGVWQIYTWSA